MMADKVHVTNMPEAGSRFAVSLELTKLILAAEATIDYAAAYTQANVLKVYKACSDTVGY